MEYKMNKTVTTATHGSGAAREAAPSTIKRPYAKPQLKTYGELREITTTVALLSNPDGQIQILNPLIGTALLL